MGKGNRRGSKAGNSTQATSINKGQPFVPITEMPFKHGDSWWIRNEDALFRLDDETEQWLPAYKDKSPPIRAPKVQVIEQEEAPRRGGSKSERWAHTFTGISAVAALLGAWSGGSRASCSEATCHCGCCGK
jgi:hypothetical protein